MAHVWSNTATTRDHLQQSLTVVISVVFSWMKPSLVVQSRVCSSGLEMVIGRTSVDDFWASRAGDGSPTSQLVRATRVLWRMLVGGCSCGWRECWCRHRCWRRVGSLMPSRIRDEAPFSLAMVIQLLRKRVPITVLENSCQVNNLKWRWTPHGENIEWVFLFPRSSA